MVEVLFFAQLQEEVGKEKITVPVENISIKELKENYLRKYDIASLLDEAMVAVNEEYAPESTIVKSGDVVAFIPPVSGG